MWSVATAPAGAAVPAVHVFSERLAQHVLIEREIRDDLLQATILLFERPQLPQLTHPQVGEALLPDVECRVADAELPAYVRHRRPALGLAQGVGELRFTELRLLHGPTSSPSGALDRQRYGWDP